jgi:hypothetical protein
MKEVWKSVVGFEGEYEVSNLGRLRSLPRIRIYLFRGKIARRFYPGKVQKPQQQRSGHLRVKLRRKHGARQVHRLVLEAFVGPQPNMQETLHCDGNPTNNRIDNLRWGTRAENVADAIRHGDRLVGEDRRDSRLRNIDIPHIRRRCLSEPIRTIAKDFSVSIATILAIRDGRTWRNISPVGARYIEMFENDQKRIDEALTLDGKQ